MTLYNIKLSIYWSTAFQKKNAAKCLSNAIATGIQKSLVSSSYPIIPDATALECKHLGKTAGKSQHGRQYVKQTGK